MRPLASLLIVWSCFAGACGGDWAGDSGVATTAGRPAATKPAPKTDAAVAAADPVGAWTLDVDGFVEENWAQLLSTAEPGIELIREGHARIEALPEAQREEATRRMRASLSPSDLEIHDVALAGPEAVKEWAKETLRTQLGTSRFDVTLAKDGSCSLSFDMHGYRSDAAGTWTPDRDGVTVRLTTVDGRPAKAKDRAPKTLAIRDDRLLLAFAPGGPTLVARRRG